MQIADHAQRRQALNTAESFIVQAPAGSGKTELLTQRYLSLLATVDEPENIVAITFTRKAAAEMRDRILKALQAASGPEPSTEHERQTWQLASAALMRDGQQGLGVLASPSRLRVQTIDALCGSLVRQMPVLSQLGGSPSTVDDARPLYQEAAERALQEALAAPLNSEANQVARTVLVHMDGHFPKVLELLAAMLCKRDQWLRHLASGQDAVADTSYFESVVSSVVEQQLQQLNALIDSSQRKAIQLLCSQAAANLLDGHKMATLAEWRYVLAEDDACWRCRSEDLPLWLGIAQCLLKADGEVRSARGLNKNYGFPAGDAGKQLKQDFVDVVDGLAPAFIEALDALRLLPSGDSLESELEVLPAIAGLLRAAVLELHNLFVERSQIDHAQVTQMALQALGDPESPTDLALALDYQIQHVLADEVQDTSHNQFELFRRLTAGWQAGDGRSFFAVGDPMQSIYGFREADVGLFLNAWHHGLSPAMPLTPLQLQVNFRSQADIVAWVNEQFSEAFPPQEDSLLGAIPYAPSVAFHSALDRAAVCVQTRHVLEEKTEAEQALDVIHKSLADADVASIAVLGRSRGHVAEIVQQLRAEGIPYRAVELENLGDKAVVSDLMQLTFALLYPADRLAWLAVLRSPLLGLSLADLLVLCDGDKGSVLPLLMQQRLPELSTDGQQRVQRLLASLPARQDPRALYQQVESIWAQLGGLQLASADDLDAARLYIDTLAHVESQSDAIGSISSVDELARAVASLYAPVSHDAECKIDVMTMHKSKGLQFDVVLLPGLNRKAKADDNRLLYLQEMTLASGEEAVLLAPLAGKSKTESGIYRWLRELDKQKSRLESVRLLYVAATRAKQRLYLFASLRPSKTGEAVPTKDSLLAPIWSGLLKAGLCDDRLPDIEPVEDESDAPGYVPRLQRQAAGAEVVTPPSSVKWQGNEAHQLESEEALEFDWASPAAMIIGTVLHQLLQTMAEQGVGQWSVDSTSQLEPAIQAQLAEYGLSAEANQQAAKRVLRGLRNTLSDEQGLWLLGEQQEAVCEAAFSHVDVNGAVRHSIVDRSFVNDGVRWIVDYKTGGHEGGDVEGFLENEKLRYADQLNRYGDVYAQLEQRPIKLALYFPMLKKMVSWDYEPA